MKKVVLQDFTSDVSNPASYDPENPSSFHIEVQFWIGVEGDTGGELFRLYVCSPDNLATLCQDGSPRSGRGMLITNEYRKEEVRTFIERVIGYSQGETWDDVVKALSRYAYWAEE